jgi:hypothetical protein
VPSACFRLGLHGFEVFHFLVPLIADLREIADSSEPSKPENRVLSTAFLSLPYAYYPQYNLDHIIIMPEEMHRVQLDMAPNLIPSASEPGRSATQIADNTIASKADPVHMLGFMSLRGSIASTYHLANSLVVATLMFVPIALTQHVGTLTQQLHVLSQEVETLSKRDDYLTRGDLVRELQGQSK